MAEDGFAFSGGIRGIYSALVLEVAFRTARKIVRGCVGVPRIWLTSRCKRFIVSANCPIVYGLAVLSAATVARMWLEYPIYATNLARDDHLARNKDALSDVEWRNNV